MNHNPKRRLSSKTAFLTLLTILAAQTLVGVLAQFIYARIRQHYTGTLQELFVVKNFWIAALLHAVMDIFGNVFEPYISPLLMGIILFFPILGVLVRRILRIVALKGVAGYD